jgi:hypothetical protein
MRRLSPPQSTTPPQFATNAWPEEADGFIRGAVLGMVAAKGRHPGWGGESLALHKYKSRFILGKPQAPPILQRLIRQQQIDIDDPWRCTWN